MTRTSGTVSNDNATRGPDPSRWDRLPACARRCRTYRARVRTERIGYVNAVLESYDVLARVRTEDIQRGVLAVTVPEDWDALFHSVMAALKSEAGVELFDDAGVDFRSECDKETRSE